MACAGQTLHVTDSAPCTEGGDPYSPARPHFAKTLRGDAPEENLASIKVKECLTGRFDFERGSAKVVAWCSIEKERYAKRMRYMH